MTEDTAEVPPCAFIGLRGCDLAAIATLDRVLGRGTFPDGSFVKRRQRLFVVAVNCTEPGGLCFCASMGTGPAAGPGYDLALTEQVDGDGRRYLVDVGTRRAPRCWRRCRIVAPVSPKPVVPGLPSQRRHTAWAARCRRRIIGSC